MQIDNATLETLIEQITKQVLIVLNEQSCQPAGPSCNCDGTACVRDCTDNVSQAMAAGATRVESVLGSAHDHANLAS